MTIALAWGLGFLCAWFLVDSYGRWRVSRRLAKRAVVHRYRGVLHFLGLLTLVFYTAGKGDLTIAPTWNTPIRTAGLVLAALGWSLVLWGRRSLGAAWTADVSPVAPRERVRHGPYAVLRHPIYVGESIFFVGISICLANTYAFIFLALIGSIYNIYRAWLEDGLAKGQRPSIHG